MSTSRASWIIPALLLLAAATPAGAASSDRQQEMLIGADYTNAELDGDGERRQPELLQVADRVFGERNVAD